MSAECMLAGLYPPEDTQIWNPNISWQPISVHTTPMDIDNVCILFYLPPSIYIH